MLISQPPAAIGISIFRECYGVGRSCDVFRAHHDAALAHGGCHVAHDEIHDARAQ